MNKAKVTIWVDEVKGRIDPDIYGHFAEHLGGCIYDGIWVGENSEIPNEGGIRKDTAQAFKELSPPILRWPGGCFADAYHFEDGIGPREKRPKRWNIWWEQEESNQFGTDEFIRFCRMTGAKAYICLNVGSGSIEEALNWMEYCNSSADVHYANLRRQNGQPEPYNVGYWSVGNENWGCGGPFDPEDYGKVYRRFVNYLRRANPDVKFIACGGGAEWNEGFFKGLGDRPYMVDYLSIHRYFHAGNDVDFSDSDYYDLMAQVKSLEDYIELTAKQIETFARGRKKIWIALDEWGVWHPQARVPNGLWQQNTLRDAIFAARVLNLLNLHCDKVGMANIAQTFNVLQCVAFTEGPKMCLTPTYWTFHMFKGHMGAELLRCETDSALTFKVDGGDLPALDLSASRNKGEITLTLVNQHLTEDVKVKVALIGARANDCAMRVLTAEDPRAHNTFERPDVVRPMEGEFEVSDGEVTALLPSKSVVLLEIKT